MVDRITKRLQKMSRKDRDVAERIMVKIKRGEIVDLRSDNTYKKY